MRLPRFIETTLDEFLETTGKIYADELEGEDILKFSGHCESVG